jgi:hypothetical protein
MIVLAMTVDSASSPGEGDLSASGGGERYDFVLSFF